MGRALLISVLGLTLAIAYATLNRGEGRGLFARGQAVSEAGAIAHEAAESGFGIAAATIRADLSARPSDSGVRVDGDAFGTYSAATADLAHGSVSVRAVGEYGPARHLVEGEVIELFRVGTALLAHGEKVKLNVGDDARIAGGDHRPPSVAIPLRSGVGQGAPAVGFTSEDVREDVMGRLSAEARARLSGSSPTTLMGVPTTAYDLVEAIRASPATVRAADVKLERSTLGTPTAPVVYYATGEVKLGRGFVGYGVLVADRKVVLERNARWEGLIILRAEADGKSQLVLKGDAQVVGSVVLLGEEDLHEEPDSPGLPGGHFDLDIFEGSGAPLGRAYHKHEWDDSYNLTYVDFLSGPDISESFRRFQRRMGRRLVRVEFVNEFNASGTYRIGALPSPWMGTSADGFEQTMSLAGLTDFRLSLSQLSELRGTYPGRVKDDATGRDRSFTVRFYDGPALVYAVSVYEHTKGEPRDGLSLPTRGASTETAEAYGAFEVELGDDAALLYSEEAVGRLGRVLPVVRGGGRTQILVTRSVPGAP